MVETFEDNPQDRINQDASQLSIKFNRTNLLRMSKNLTAYWSPHVPQVVEKLPAMETTPIILIRFTSDVTPELNRLIKERLQEANIIIVEDEKDVDGNTVLGLSTTDRELEHEAEHQHLYKVKTLKNLSADMNLFEGSVIMDNFTVSEKHSFILESDQKDNVTVYDSSGIFTSADRLMLVNSLLESMAVLAPSAKSSPLSMKLNEVLKFSSVETDERFHKLYLLDTLKNQGYVDAVVPIHADHLKDHICSRTMDPWTKVPLQAICDYYGEEVAFYFAWMSFYVKSLFFPGITGLFIFVLRVSRGESIDTDIFTPFHGLFTFIWAIAFIQFWSREEARLSYRWGTWNCGGRKHDSLTVRHEFQGIMRKNEVTKMMEKYYPPNKRRLKYCVSAFVTLILLSGAFFVMILSLNMQGYIKHKHDSKSWYTPSNQEAESHPFHFEYFANLSGKGRIFDCGSTIQSTLAVILHVTLVLSMNMGYRKVAELLTDWENHESRVTYSNSMIFKRFFFEAFDAYIVLMYLAFYEQDVNKVRSELINVFNVDTFRRLLLEGVIPFIQTKMRLRLKLYSQKKLKTYDSATKKSSNSLFQENVNKDDYEEFDDYIEMIIQFGYICLFASAYPLAPFVAIIANFIELRLDVLKVTHVHRRPFATPVPGIGVWSDLIKCIVWMSAITNCMIFCFSSRQMVQFLPQFFIVSDEEHNLKDENGWVMVFIVFGIERALLVLGIIICISVPTVPEDVRVQQQQKEYIETRMHHADRSQKNSKKDD